MSGTETVALYHPDDVVGAGVGAAPRQVRAENLPARGIRGAGATPDGRVLVHRRAEGKDLWPGAHDAACGGVVLAGESPDDATRRELAEEVSIEGALTVRGVPGSPGWAPWSRTAPTGCACGSRTARRR